MITLEPTYIKACEIVLSHKKEFLSLLQEWTYQQYASQALASAIVDVIHRKTYSKKTIKQFHLVRSKYWGKTGRDTLIYQIGQRIWYLNFG